jgi:flagellar biogenesis protein FliO
MRILFRRKTVLLTGILACFLFPLQPPAQESAKTNTAVKDIAGPSRGATEQSAPPAQGEPAAPADAGTVEAQPAPNYEYTEPEFGTDRLSYPVLVLRTLVILAIIVVSIYLFFRYLVKKRNRVVAETDIIKVHATFPLATNRLIQVVEIADKMLVLGVSDSNINLITELADRETIDRIKVMSSKESGDGQGFRDQFMKLLGGKIFSKGGQLSYMNTYRKRIDRMKKL